MNEIVLAPTSLPNAEPLDYVDAAARAGYDGIGIRLFRSPGITYAFHPVAGDKELMRQVKGAISASGMKVYDVLSFYMQPETDLESMQPALAYGAEIGAKYALVIGDDPEWGRMVDNFGRFCDTAAGYNLVASIEAPVTQRIVNTLEKSLRLISDSGRQNAVVCLDPFHYWRTGHTPDQLKGKDPRLFPYSQIDDGGDDQPAPAGRCAVGEGKVPLDAILDALPAGLPLSLEWSAPRNSGYSAAEWAKIALDGTKKFLTGYYQRRGA